MEFFKMFASLPDMKEVMAADDAEIGSLGLLVQCMCYCTSTGSPGFVPDGKMYRFGGARLTERTEALAAEGLLIRGERGWHINPEAWCEERNLNDAAERKREADRKRMQAKRATERDKSCDGVANQTRTESRDSRTTGRATPSRDSRALEVEVDKTPPLPPRRRQPPTPPGPPLLDLVPTGEGEDQSEEGQDRDELVAQARVIRPDWSTASIRRALGAPEVRERPWPLVRVALLAIAADPASQQPGRLAHDGPWWRQDPRASAPPVREPCGTCEDRRMIDNPDGTETAVRCPACRPPSRPVAVAG